MKTDYSYLFTLRYRLSGGTCTIHAHEGPFDGSHTRIDVEVCWTSQGKTTVVFPLGATWSGIPAHWSLDGNGAKEAVSSLVAMHPSAGGGEGEEYYASYTPEQLAWCESHGKELDAQRETRYCDENGSVK